MLLYFNELDLYDYYVNGLITKGNTVHHIIEISINWGKRLQLDNLFLTTSANHDIIHANYKKDLERSQRLMFDIVEQFKTDFKI